MPLAVIGAVASGVGAVASAAIGASANNHAADVAAANNAANDRLSQQQYDSTKALVQPYVDGGDKATDALQGFLGLGGDPAATQKAFNDYLGSTGYEFNLDQGLNAATQSAAASGMLNSGAALKSLQDRGAGIADTYGQQYVDNLNAVANRGTNAVGALTGAGAANVANQTANNNAGTAAQTGAINANANLTSGLVNGLTGAFGKVVGQSSFGGGNAMTGYSTAFNQPGYAPFGEG